MNYWRASLVIALVVATTLAVALFRGSGPNNANHPDGVTMICGACGHTWRLTMRQISDHHVANYGQPLPCPECGQRQGIAAAKDTNTGRWASQKDANPYAR